MHKLTKKDTKNTVCFFLLQSSYSISEIFYKTHEQSKHLSNLSVVEKLMYLINNNPTN